MNLIIMNIGRAYELLVTLKKKALEQYFLLVMVVVRLLLLLFVFVSNTAIKRNVFIFVCIKQAIFLKARTSVCPK